jgi:PBSX family phage terminase large subunit
MNPSHPKHKVKQWIDKAEQGDSNYYALHFTMDDTPYVDDAYKARIRDSSSGLFYKRNYLGLWCLAEGSVFDFFDPKIYVIKRPPTAADYWIAGIDYGASNPFACLVIGVSSGKNTQSQKVMWVEREYYWDHKAKERTKTNSELAADVQELFQDYDIKQVYIDPSAASFKAELRKLGIRPIDANNDVEEGIYKMTSEMKRGMIYICQECKNTIREIESYVWDSKAAQRGYDEPLKKDDHAIDALRYAINTHKITEYKPYADRTLGFNDMNDRFRNR